MCAIKDLSQMMTYSGSLVFFLRGVFCDASSNVFVFVFLFLLYHIVYFDQTVFQFIFSR